MNLSPTYSQRTIGSIAALARTLGHSVADIQRIAHKADSLYREVPQEKPDGSLRMTYDARPPLKYIQHRAMTQILQRVKYPLYLQGGIKDRDNPRDYVRNAEIHKAQRIVIKEDIKDFFPSLSQTIVNNVWRGFFRFPADVADCLTRLTTYNGQLPQGAKTSSYLANLAFWDREHRLVQTLESQGIRYSRLADDITLSASRSLDNDEKAKLIALVYGMMFSRGVQPKRSKHQVLHQGQRMLVNNLLVNGEQVSLSRTERQAIKAAVFECEKLAVQDDIETESYRSTYARTMGRVGKLIRLGHPLGTELKRRLQAVAPAMKSKSVS